MKKGYILGTILFLAFPLLVLGADEKTETPEPGEYSTIASDMIAKIKFKEESFGDDVRQRIINGLRHSEIWREKVSESLVAPIDKVKDLRKDMDKIKPEIKVMSFLHLRALQILQFIFSIGFVFYGLAVVLAILVIKKLFAFLGWIFRRKAEQA